MQKTNDPFFQRWSQFQCLVYYKGIFLSIHAAFWKKSSRISLPGPDNFASCLSMQAWNEIKMLSSCLFNAQD